VSGLVKFLKDQDESKEFILALDKNASNSRLSVAKNKEDPLKEMKEQINKTKE